MTASPASAAVAPFGPPAAITPPGCFQTRVTFDRFGYARGYAQCMVDTVFGLYAVQGSGAVWRRTRVTVGYWDVLDVADDGINTYALVRGSTTDVALQPVEGPTTWATAASPGGLENVEDQLSVVIRSRAGRVTTRVLQLRQGSVEPSHGSVIGYGGRWWAVWAIPDAACACEEIWTARTMLAPYRAHRTGLHGRTPDLANRGNSAVLTWSEGPTVGGHIAYGFPRGGDFTVIKTGYEGFQPVISYAGGVYRIAYNSSVSGQGRPVLVTRSAGGWRSFDLTTVTGRGLGPTGVDPIFLAVTGTTVTLAWTTRRADGPWAAMVARRVGGVWSARRVPDGLTGSAGSLATDLSHVRGRAYLVLDHVGTSRRAVLRHQ